MPAKKTVKKRIEENIQEDAVPVEDLNSTTGVKGLDGILGGGFPKGHVVLLSGSSGSGKTILSFQWLFEGIKQGENGIYITFTEPLFKSMKNLEGLEFYDRSAIEDERLKIVDMRDVYASPEFDSKRFLESIEKEVKETGAKRLCIDSITAIAYAIDDKYKIRRFIFDLGRILSVLGCTTVLTSEVSDHNQYSVYGVEEFISDAIIKIDQVVSRGDFRRELGIIKVRGRHYTSDNIFFRITDRGIKIFPKLNAKLEHGSSGERISIGVPTMDEMFGGGIFRGSSTILAGTTGTGKTLTCLHFIVEGLKNNEPCLYAGFEESRDQLIRTAKGFGWDLEKYEKSGLLTFRCVYPGSLHVEEHMNDIRDIVEANGIKRVVVDSLYSISNSFPTDEFTEFTNRTNAYLKSKGITTLFTVATTSLIGSTVLTESNVSVIADNIIRYQYVEAESQLKLVMSIVKIRGSAHSKGLREYTISNHGLMVGQGFIGYEGIMTGIGRKVSDTITDKIEKQFRNFLGPMSDAVMSEIKASGMSQSYILGYIDSLLADGIIGKDDHKEFKENVMRIMGSHSHSVSEEDMQQKGFIRKK